MPRVSVNPDSVVRTGLTGTERTLTAGANNGLDIANPGNGSRTFIKMRNNGATPRTVTIDVKLTVDGYSVTDPTISLGASETRYAGPFPTPTFGSTLGVDVDHADARITAFHLA